MAGIIIGFLLFLESFRDIFVLAVVVRGMKLVKDPESALGRIIKLVMWSVVDFRAWRG
jgi:hypothetical protein